MKPKKLLSVGGVIPPSDFLYIHNTKKNSSTAYTKNERAKLLFRIPRALGATRLALEIFSEDGEHICNIDAAWKSIDGSRDVYSAVLPLRELGVGLFFLRPTLTAGASTLYGHKYGRELYFDESSARDGLMQLTVSEFEYAPPEDIYGGVIYHIFVDRFMRGGKTSVPKSAKIVDGEWERIPEYPEYPGAPLKNNTFYGGTLWGIAKKLDYIASLGVTALYLSPIFESVSNHKYDTANYMKVDGMFGGDRALRHLISECSKRNIKIILDGVFNHTGADSIYFNRYGTYESLGAYQSKSSEFYPWFDFKDYPSKYTCWWGIEILPRINPDISECRDYFISPGGVISKYADMGVYGFRLDVADELSDGFIAGIKSTLSKKKDSVLYGEVWEDASNKIAYDKRKKYYLGKELDGVMNYPLRRGIIDFIKDGATDSLFYALTDIIDNAPKRIADAQMNLLGTHDTERILTLLGGVSAEGLSNGELVSLRMTGLEREGAIEKLLMAYTLLGTLPGVPTIFYGDEAGLEGYSDPFNRMPYPWGREEDKLLSHYKKIGKIRKENAVYKRGALKLYTLTDDLLVFSRTEGFGEYMTVINRSQTARTVEFSEGAKALIAENRAISHKLPPFTAEIFKIKGKTKAQIT